MSEIFLNLLTKNEYSNNIDPLEKIWSLDNWYNSLDRVKDISIKDNYSDYQRFKLVFDADNEELDCIEVERFRSINEIKVNHIIPPPNIIKLSAKWWVSPDQGNILFVKRNICIDSSIYTPFLAKKMFSLLRKNLLSLIKD